jgi:Predicted membrane protein
MINKLVIHTLDLYYKLLASNKIRFLFIGALGFVVNYLSLGLFFDLMKLSILISQIIGVELAVIVTFIGNNYWTFKGHQNKSMVNKFIKFQISALGGVLINSGIVISTVQYLHFYYGISLIIGSLVGLIWNYTLYKKFVFRTKIELKI